MTQIDFIALCGQYLIDPGLALENDAIREALKRGDDNKVKALLQTEF